MADGKMVSSPLSPLFFRFFFFGRDFKLIGLNIKSNNNPISVKNEFQKNVRNLRKITLHIILSNWIVPGGTENCRPFFPLAIFS